MNLRYVVKELYHRRRRTFAAVLGLSLGIAILVVINALSLAFRQAARAPLQEIGAELTIQRSGDVPREMSGAVFPCSAVTIRRDELEKIRALPGLRGMGTGLLLWVFDPGRASVVLGVEPENDVGPGVLRASVTQGRFPARDEAAAVAEVSWAKQSGIRLGDRLRVAGTELTVVGIADASRAPKIAVANLYVPLPQAQRMAASSPQVQSVSPFGPADVNLVFVNADPKAIASVGKALKALLGKKATVATPESFLKSLGNLFALSDRFTLIASLIAIATAVLVTFKTMAGNTAERVREVGVLKAVGWTDRNVTLQLTAEAVLQSLLGGALGLACAFLIGQALGFVTIRIPIPWEMSPTPHFLPGGGVPLFKTVRLAVRIPWQLAGFAVLLSILTGAATGGLLGRQIASLKPSEVLRHE
ncbi:MAG: ABC transporter permease [Deltaproteobacteria bacterium]|nr:ABC transporter permease [Deltaproteobacteria bacterium]